MRLSHFVFLLTFYAFILYFNPKRYTPYVPTFQIYPDNEEEVKEVAKHVHTRTHFDETFFYKTDNSVSVAFSELIPEYSVGELDTMFHKISPVIVSLKYAINRARPGQIDSSLNTLRSQTAHTPAYPSGHAFQAYYLAKQLSKIHKNKQNELYSLARKCDLVRVKAGIHFPSDGMAAKRIVDVIF
jgi:hypothetical protein